MSGEGVDIDLYADDIGEDFNTDEFPTDGVDLYDDVITEGRPDGEGVAAEANTNDVVTTISGTPTNNVNSVSKPVTPSSTSSSDGHRDSIMPLRKHQVYVGNLTWWTSDKDIQDALDKLDIRDFVEVKFYENRANGQSKGYCVLTVGSDTSIKIIHDRLGKLEIHGQPPVVTPPTKQALNQFEAQAKTRSGSSGGGQGQNNSGGMDRNGPPNMNMNMNMMGPRGPMPMGPGMGFGQNPRMMMGGPGGMRGMGPPPHMGGPPPPQMQPRGMGPPNHHNPQGGYGGPRQMPPQNMPPIPGGPGQRMPMMNEPFYQNGPHQMGPRGPVGPPGMMDPRGPPPRGGPGPGDWRPQVNTYPPHVQPPMGPGPGPHSGPMSRGQGPPAMIGGPGSAPAPHMNPAFFHPSPNGPPNQPPGPIGYNPPVSAYPPQIDHRNSPSMSEAEFEEVMSRNRTVSSSAISRAVSDAATGEFASAIETLVTAISLIKQSKVANDDRCKILVSSLQDTLHGIENKSYGRRVERSRSRERERHRRSRRERSRSPREREPFRDRSRERYYEYPRERSRSREYRERPREETSTRAYYEEPRYRERAEREPRTRVAEPERSREREREPEREVVSSHRAPRH